MHDDTVVVLAVTRMDVIYIWHHRGFDCENRLFCMPDGRIVDIMNMKAVMHAGEWHVLDKKFSNAKLLQRLELTYEETVLLGSLALMSPGEARTDV